MSKDTKCCLIGMQANQTAPYIILQYGEDADIIKAVSSQELEELSSRNAMLVQVSPNIKLPLEEYADLHLSTLQVTLAHPFILWDILSALICESAEFKVPNIPNRVFKFADISFSMKTDEVSISYFENGTKQVYVLWSTPSLNMPTSDGSILVKCSDRLKQKILGSSQSAEEIAGATRYFSSGSEEKFFSVNLSHMTCAWDTSYCLKRFHTAELSALVSYYEINKAIATGYDLANMLLSDKNVMPEQVFSHTAGKSRLSTSGISFRLAAFFPNAIKIAEMFSNRREDVVSIINSHLADKAQALMSFILSSIPDTINTYYLKVICNTVVESYLANCRNIDISLLQRDITDAACRIFQYKMAYTNPVLRIPDTIPFQDGRLLIYKGG